MSLYVLHYRPYNKHNTKFHAPPPPVGLEPTILVSERPKTHALDRTATGIGSSLMRTLNPENLCLMLKSEHLIWFLKLDIIKYHLVIFIVYNRPQNVCVYVSLGASVYLYSNFCFFVHNSLKLPCHHQSLPTVNKLPD
jgi:hypothetical protein